MGDDTLAMLGVRVQRIRIVTEPGDRDAGLLDEIANPPGLLVAEVCHIDMGHAGVAAIRASRRPAHQFNAAKSLVGSEREDLVEGQVGEDRADETKLHTDLRIRKTTDEHRWPRMNTDGRGGSEEWRRTNRGPHLPCLDLCLSVAICVHLWFLRLAIKPRIRILRIVDFQRLPGEQ